MALGWHHKDLELDYGSTDWSDSSASFSKIDDDAFARAIREGRDKREYRTVVPSR
jgi:hypothetical protein